MRYLLPVLIVALALPGCSHQAVSLKSMLGMERIEVSYLTDDGRWVAADSLDWRDRSWYRQLRFDTDGDGQWNYLYNEVFDDVAGWIWIPSSARINPDQEPELAARKKHLVEDQEPPPDQPSLDDFGYKRR